MRVPKQFQLASIFIIIGTYTFLVFDQLNGLEFGSQKLLHSTVFIERAILFSIPFYAITLYTFPRLPLIWTYFIILFLCVEATNRSLFSEHLHNFLEENHIFPWFLYKGPLKEVNHQYTYVLITILSWLYLIITTCKQKNKTPTSTMPAILLTASIGTVAIFHTIIFMVGLMQSLYSIDEHRLQAILTNTNRNICTHNAICFEGNRVGAIEFLQAKQRYSTTIHHVTGDSRKEFLTHGMIHRNVLGGNAMGAVYAIQKNDDTYFITLDNIKLQKIVNLYTHINTLLILLSHSLWLTLFIYSHNKHKNFRHL